MVSVFGDRERLSSIVDLVFEQMLPILHTSTEEACETYCSVIDSKLQLKHTPAA